MSCSICGNEGHNARTCPQLLPTSQGNSNKDSDYALWLRYGGLSKAQTKALKNKIEDFIEEVAPDSHGVIAAGKASKLPQRIQEAIKSTQVIPKTLDKK